MVLGGVISLDYITDMITSCTAFKNIALSYKKSDAS